MTKKKPYFHNNVEALMEAPAEYFHPIPYDEFMDWKIGGWELPSSCNYIIREQNIKTGKVKEYVYQRKSAARKKMLKLLNEQKHEILICTHDNIQHLKPEKYITEHDEDTFHTQ